MGGDREREDSEDEADFPSPVSLLLEALAPFSKTARSSVRSLLRWLGGEVGERTPLPGDAPMFVVLEPGPMAACLRARSFAKIAGRSLYDCLMCSIIAMREELEANDGSVAGRGSRMGS